MCGKVGTMRLIGLLAILVASPAWAGLVSRPTKTCGTTSYVAEVAAGCTTIKSSEVDADFFAIITGGVNNIETANINAAGLGTAAYANASVTAAKLAPNAVTAANIADGSITSAKIADDTIVNADVNSAAGILGTKLAVGAAINSTAGSGALAGEPISSGTGETTLATQALTVRGGVILIHSSVAVSGATGGAATMTIRCRRSGTLVAAATFSVAGAAQVLIPPVPFTDAPAAGTYTYTYTLQVSAGSFSTDGTSPGQLLLFELT